MSLFIRINALLLSILMAWAAASVPIQTLAQQEYNPAGYTCNGASKTCNAYALYRTSQEGETLQKVGGYFNKSATSISAVSGLSVMAPDSILTNGQFLYIPVDCSCQNSTSQMEVVHTVVHGDTIRQLAVTVFGGLTTIQAMEALNPTMDTANLQSGDVIRVPIFCACPTAAQIADGAKFLLTHTVYPNETLSIISGYFGMTAAKLAAANQLPVNASLSEHSILVVPLAVLPTVALLPSPAKAKSDWFIVGIVAGGSAMVLTLVAFAVCLYLRRKRALDDLESGDKEGLAEIAGIPGFISYKDLSAATNRFCEESKLGEGGFGRVYKGVLPRTGTRVAVKKVSNYSSQGEREFLAEVQIISQLRHRNVVELMGFCRNRGKFLLVYELLPKGSLDRALFKSKTFRDRLSWSQRWKIVSGIAAALHYLHEGWRQQVIHRDVKPSNIMLDDEYNPKLGDFGLARLVDHAYSAPTTNIAGTFGYIAPEATSGKFTDKTDVFAFGAVALEVACGRRALNASAECDDLILVDLVWRRLEEGNLLSVADPSLLGDFDGEQMCNVLKVGLLCSHPDPSSRPSMREVVQVLAGVVDTPDVPHSKPKLSFKLRSPRFSIDDMLISSSQRLSPEAEDGQQVSAAQLSSSLVSGR